MDGKRQMVDHVVLQEFDLTAANDRFEKLDTPETGTDG